MTPADRAGETPTLTADPIMVGRPIAPMPLEAYEGYALLVSGNQSGGWIYEVKVIDQAGPILTALLQHVFG